MNCDNAITVYSGITTRNATIQSARILWIKWKEQDADENIWIKGEGITEEWRKNV